VPNSIKVSAVSRMRKARQSDALDVIQSVCRTYPNNVAAVFGFDRRTNSMPGLPDTGASILVEARLNARWSLDFVHDHFACGRRFRVLNIDDDVTRECPAAIPDTSISGRLIARELTDLIGRRGKPDMIVLLTMASSSPRTNPSVVEGSPCRMALYRARQADAKRLCPEL